MTKVIKYINRKSLYFSAAVVIGITAGRDAYAETDFSNVTGRLTESVGQMPEFITGLAYILGVLLSVLGILKIKDHVENPSSTKLQEGAIRLAAGGGLLALPFMHDVMIGSIGGEENAAAVAHGQALNWSGTDTGF